MLIDDHFQNAPNTDAGRGLFGILAPFALVTCLALALSGCGNSSAPEVTFADTTPEDFYDGARTLDIHALSDLAAANPLFDITDDRGINYGTVAISAGRPADPRMPLCPTAIPGPLTACIPYGAQIVKGRLNLGVAEFGGETGLYYLDQQAICFSALTHLQGCHRLAIRYDDTIEVKTSQGTDTFWVLKGAQASN